MFVSWCLLNGMAGPLHAEEYPEPLAGLQERRVTPGHFIVDIYDEKFTDEDLNDAGNGFAAAYFGTPSDRAQYLTDYEETLGAGAPTLYDIQDSWENFDKLAPIIERRYGEWKAGKLTLPKPLPFDVRELIERKPWWKFW